MTRLVTRTEISASDALGLVQTALAHASDNGWEVAVAVADPRGHLVAFLRSDNVFDPAIGFAIDKAYTAATLRRSSEAFGARMASSPALSLGFSTRERFITWAGGLPIFCDGTCIGGMGVSGAKDHEDIACAQAALTAQGFQAEA